MANQESRRLFKAYNQSLWAYGPDLSQKSIHKTCNSSIFCDPEVPEEPSREKLDFLQKKILKNISFQDRNEVMCNDPDNSNQSVNCEEDCVNLLSILEHVNEAECYEMILQTRDENLPPPNEIMNIISSEGPQQP